MDVRIDALKGVVAGLDREDVQRISLPLPDDARRAALARAVAAAEAAGRGPELAGLRARMRREAFVRYDRALLRPTWLGLNWGLSSGTSEDRVAVAAALDEAAVIVIADDLLTEADRDVLGWAPEVLLGSAMHDTDSGSLAHALPGDSRGQAATAAAAIGGTLLGIGLIVAPFVAGAPPRSRDVGGGIPSDRASGSPGRRAPSRVSIRVVPATPDRWDDVVTLLGGASDKVCWCQAPRGFDTGPLRHERRELLRLSSRTTSRPGCSPISTMRSRAGAGSAFVGRCPGSTTRARSRPSTSGRCGRSCA